MVFVDTALSNWSALVTALEAANPGIGIELVDGGRSGLARIAAWSESHSGYDAIHILSHGEEGGLFLGTDLIDAADLSDSAVRADWAAVGAALSLTSCADTLTEVKFEMANYSNAIVPAGY